MAPVNIPVAAMGLKAKANDSESEHAAYWNDVAKVGYAIPQAIATKPTVAANINSEIDKVIKSGADAKTFVTKISAFINGGCSWPRPLKAPPRRRSRVCAAGVRADGLGSRTFVGFDNFIGVLQDPS